MSTEAQNTSLEVVKKDNTPSMARLIINQCQLAHELFTETIKNNKKVYPEK